MLVIFDPSVPVICLGQSNSGVHSHVEGSVRICMYGLISFLKTCTVGMSSPMRSNILSAFYQPLYHIVDIRCLRLLSVFSSPFVITITINFLTCHFCCLS